MSENAIPAALDEALEAFKRAEALVRSLYVVDGNPALRPVIEHLVRGFDHVAAAEYRWRQFVDANNTK